MVLLFSDYTSIRHNPTVYNIIDITYMRFIAQNRDYNRSPTSVGTFDVNGAAHVASRILGAILLASKNWRT